MSFLNFFSKKEGKEQIQYGNNINASPEEQIREQIRIDFDEIKDEFECVCISTSGDENVCPMCAQFEGKFFLRKDAPKLPLCPSCACAYMYYDKRDLPSDAVISQGEDFIFPAECVPMFYKVQHQVWDEKDVDKRIRLCRRQLNRLNEFMQPYLSGNFPAPIDLACRDMLPSLYMQTGEWNKAESVIKTCIDAKAYFPGNGYDALAGFERYKRVANETLTYISGKPGCLQSGIYKAMGYENEDRECLKDFLRNSKLIKKIRHNSTYELYCADSKA